MMTKAGYKLGVAVSAVSLSLAIGLQAGTATADWIQTAPGLYNWNDANNWTAAFPNGQGEVANLTNNIAGQQTNFLNQASIIIGILNIGDTDASHRKIIGSNASGQVLAFNNGSSPAQINQTAGSSGDVLAVPITFTAGLAITNNAAAAKSLTLAGSVSGTGRITLQSAADNAVIFSPAADMTIPNNISGPGILAKAGPKSLTLTGNNAVVLKGGYSITGGGPLILSGGIFTNTAPVAGNLPFGAAGNTFRVEGGAKYYCPVGVGVSMSPGYQRSTTLLTGAGTVWNSGDNVLTLNQSYGTLVVANDALMTNVRTLGAGNNATQCSIVITNGGRIVNGPVAGGAVGLGYNSARNSILVQGRNPVSGADAMWTFCTGQRGIYVGDGWSNLTYSNSVTVRSGGVITNLASIYVGTCDNSHRNSLVLTGGGRMYSGSSTCGHGAKANRNFIWVGGKDPNTGIPSLWKNAGTLAVGAGTATSNNVVWVDQEGIISNITTLTVGNANDASSNAVTVTGSGFIGAAAVVVGNGSNNGNAIGVYSNGTLQCASMIVNTGVDNKITSDGGVFQFTSSTPTITKSGTGTLSLHDGVIAFQNLKGPNIFGNTTASLTNITFSGNNAFRLNNSINYTTVPQSYVFAPDAAPAYAGLEMYNGNTAYTNGTVTIASGGWLAFSNTVATMWGAVTHNGTMQINNSSVTFKNGLTLGSGCTLNWTTNSTILVNGTLTLPLDATLNVSPELKAGDTPTLLTTSNAIVGSASNWTVNPKTFRVVKINGDTQLILKEASRNFIIVVR